MKLESERNKNYPKIQTIFKRDEKGNIKPDGITCPEFDAINNWIITEKIDGMNIVVRFHKGGALGYEDRWIVSFGGKTDNAQIPVNLLNYLNKTFIENQQKFLDYFLAHDDSVKNIVLHGEGYGEGIQKGAEYIAGQEFIVFDIEIDDWWLEPEHARAICEELNLLFVPILPITTKEEAITFIQSKPKSVVAIKERPMEGIVATSRPLMLFRNGNPIKWKLKQKDYK